MTKNIILQFLLLVTFLWQCAPRDVQVTKTIKLNQIGFYPGESKIAVVPGSTYEKFYITRSDSEAKVFEGRLSSARKSQFSDEQLQVADFTSFTDSGTYVLVVPGFGNSNPFEIKENIFDDVSRASLKAFYYQRFSLELTEEFAGKWKRPASHPDDKVMVHASAATAKRPEGTILSSTRGWIDAGDYNKYIVNSGITTGTLLSAYEDFPEYYRQLNLNIPESKNAIPDLLDETLWNLRWMLTMQDPEDGGVYHKCTNASFDPMVMPHEARTQRYVVQKGTAAALNFAAVTAQASRVFKQFDQSLPGLADSCLQASQRAWLWAKANPDMEYDQEALNSKYDPDIVTGAYGDGNFTDEFIWAACELFVTTGNPGFIRDINLVPDESMPVPGWNQVKLLGYYSLLRFEKSIPELPNGTLQEIKSRLVSMADRLVTGAEAHPYQTVMGLTARDFVWGSNAVAANQAIALIQAYRISNDKRHLTFAVHNLDYILGRNATGYCYLTGFGHKSPMHIHHRPSEADGIAEPVPGLLAGGPNPGMQDKCNYSSSIPDEAYVDHVCSYASNEVAINWNAPLVYIIGASEALH